MQIEADAVIPYPRELVFRTYRDDMPLLVEFLPNVQQIDELDPHADRPGAPDDHGGDGDGETDANTPVQRSHVWHGGGEIPVAVQKVIKDSVFRWEDHGRWDNNAYECDWSIHTHAFAEAVSCVGRLRFVDLGERTRLEIEGAMRIDLSRVAGLPAFLAGGLARTVEQFVGRQITANLLGVSDAITRYLEARTVA